MTQTQTPDRRILRGVSRDIRDEILAAFNRGWTARLTRKGHVQLRHPNGAIVHAASSTGDRRSVKALRADLRRGEVMQ
jgi:hypothetical protein